MENGSALQENLPSLGGQGRLPLTFNLESWRMSGRWPEGEGKNILDKLSHFSLSTGWILFYTFCSCNSQHDARDF